MFKEIDLQNESVIQGKWEDFDQFVAERNWSEATAVMDSVGENGWESDAVRMNHILNRESKELYYEAIEDSEIPFITPVEDDAPALVGVLPDVRNPQDRADKI